VAWRRASSRGLSWRVHTDNLKSPARGIRKLLLFTLIKEKHGGCNGRGQLAITKLFASRATPQCLTHSRGLLFERHLQRTPLHLTNADSWIMLRNVYACGKMQVLSTMTRKTA